MIPLAMPNNIPICRPSLPDFSEYIKGLKKIWKNKQISNFGFYAKKFEKISQKYLNNPYVNVVSSADLGLIIALSVLNIKEKKEVILPSFTFNSTANAVKWNNLTPVFADIDPETWCLNPQDVVKKITSKTKVVIATHIFGNPCDVRKLRQICQKHKLFLIFDSAHGYGGLIGNQKIGNFGDIEVFSFSGTKVTTSAEGGLIVTKNNKYHQKITAARNYGFINNYNSFIIGLNGKISELNALLGCLNITLIDNQINFRNKVAQKYQKALDGVGDISFQKIDPQNRSTYKDFGILTSNRDKLFDYLAKKGIQTKKYFSPIHQMDFYRDDSSLPVTEEIARKCLCLPIFNEITDKQLLIITNHVKNFFKE